MKKYYFALFISLLIASSCFSQIKLPFAKWWEPEGLAVFKEAYPHVKFVCSYDKDVGDWLVHIFVLQENKKEPYGSFFNTLLIFLINFQVHANQKSYFQLLLFFY